jgi:hypothetical protein
MLIDHIGAIFLASDPKLYLLFRSIGRLAFPIFVFLIVEGFYHTHDVKKYLKRLGIFALISEIPYDLAFYHSDFGRNIFEDITAIFQNGDKNLAQLIYNLNLNQNVFFTLFLGLLLIYLMSLVEKKYEKNLLLSNLVDAALTVGFCVIAYFLRCDYNFGGILIFVAFYLFRSSKIMISFSLFIINGTVLSNFAAFTETKNIFYILQMLATFAIIPIALYNGKKGKDIKYIFYIFYPAHLLILFLISQFIL